MTDWDKELAKIDKQLASISDEELMKSAPPAAPARGGAAVPKSLPPAKGPSAGSASLAMAPAAAGKPWMAWVKVLVAVGAAAGLMYWPWPARCGAPLVGFTAATGGVALLGVWSAIGTWRHRLGWAHVASLLVTMWGLALGAREVLPRVGYAVASAERPAQWSCDGLPVQGAPASVPQTTPQTTPLPAPSGPQAGPGAAPGGNGAAPGVMPVPGGTAL